MFLDYHFVQPNIAKMHALIDDPLISIFIAKLDHIKKSTEGISGFVCRFQIEDGGVSAIRIFNDDSLLVNMYVWASVEVQFKNAYHNDHKKVLKERRKWFKKMEQALMVLGWIQTSHVPTISKAQERLEKLRQDEPCWRLLHSKISSQRQPRNALNCQNLYQSEE